MRDFSDELERRLAVMAEEHPDLQPIPATTARARRSKRRPAALGGLAAVLAACAAAFTMTGTSLAELPILGTPTQDASNLKDRAGEAAKAGVDFENAHTFGTPGGPGYALVNPKTQTMCVVIPDPAAPGDYGVSCDQPISKIEREGLRTEMVGDLSQDPDASVLVAFVLPEGADDVQLDPKPRGASLAVESGVAVVQTPSETMLRWTVDGQPRQSLIEGPFPATSTVSYACPDGSRRSGPPPPQASTPAAAQQAMKAMRKKACR